MTVSADVNGTSLWIALLGSLQLRVNRTTVAIPAAKQRRGRTASNGSRR
jgi:hypothetical protein